MTKRIGGFVIHSVILLIFFLWVVDALFLFRGRLFQLELIAFFGLVMLSVLGMMSYVREQPGLLRATYSIGVLNTLALSIIAWDVLAVSLGAAVIGLLMSFRQQQKPEQWASQHDDVKVEEIITERAINDNVMLGDVDSLHIEPLEAMVTASRDVANPDEKKTTRTAKKTRKTTRKVPAQKSKAKKAARKKR